MAAPLHRTLSPEVRIVDAHEGTVDYIASDETLDSYKEIIKAKGWRFTNFSKNSPFVDSHDYASIERSLGKVIDFKVKGDQLVERVQWAKNVQENRLAQLGWKMTEAGFLKAVSVGFWPIKSVTPYGTTEEAAKYQAELEKMGLDESSGVRRIFLQQEQVELSAVIIGANPNALAKAYKAGAVDDEDLETVQEQFAKLHAFDTFPEDEERTADTALDPAAALSALERGREAWLEKFHKLVKEIV